LAIYSPELFFTRADRELLQLLEQLILCWDERDGRSNFAAGEVPLSTSEANSLLHLLEEFIQSLKFVEGAYLIEGLFGGRALTDPSLRDIYLKWRRRVGRSRAVATIQWENLLKRVGVSVGAPNPRIWYRASAVPMPLDHFERMEMKLADAAHVHPRVKALILKVVQARRDYLEAVRFGREKLPRGSIADAPKPLLNALRKQREPVGTPPMSTTKLAGIMTIVMDFTAIYTTRDWSVTGFLSTVAGAIPPALLD
jgi:hypothetical protein